MLLPCRLIDPKPHHTLLTPMIAVDVHRSPDHVTLPLVSPYMTHDMHLL